MKSFSQRKGLKPVSEIIQTDDMNDELRISLWNTLDMHIWSTKDYVNTYTSISTPYINSFSKALWVSLKKPIDNLPQRGEDKLREIRHLFFSFKWNEVYEFIEFVIRFYKINKPELSQHINNVLARERSGYRVIDGNVVDIIDEQEVEMLEEALKDIEFEGVNAHLKRSLELLSDRENPDYRNSIKESISAVESISIIITSKEKATLGEALNELEKNNKIHKALKEGFLKLYGYTSVEGGIRHAMTKKQHNITHADAKYFLLSCTSFVNYLKSQI